jgi:glutaminase
MRAVATMFAARVITPATAHQAPSAQISHPRTAVHHAFSQFGTLTYHTGLPANSGVGGGLIAWSPGKLGLAVVAPLLDDAGNSMRAHRAIAAISNALGGSPLATRAR